MHKTYIHIVYVYVIDKFVVRFSIRNLNATDTKQMDSTKMQFPQFECVFVPMISDLITFSTGMRILYRSWCIPAGWVYIHTYSYYILIIDIRYRRFLLSIRQAIAQKQQLNIYINKSKGSQRSKKKIKKTKETEKAASNATATTPSNWNSFIWAHLCTRMGKHSERSNRRYRFTIHVHILFDSNALSEKKPLDEGWFRCFFLFQFMKGTRTVKKELIEESLTVHCEYWVWYLFRRSMCVVHRGFVLNVFHKMYLCIMHDISFPRFDNT